MPENAAARSSLPSLPRAAVRELDRQTIEDLGIPGIVLMENAGRGAARVAAELLAERQATRSRQQHGPPRAPATEPTGLEGGLGVELSGLGVLVMAGLGNNAGDGFVIGRHLLNAGADVIAVLVAPRARLAPTSDSGINLAAFTAMGGRVCEATSAEALERGAAWFDSADLIVDALFGTGLTRPLAAPFSQAVEAINAAGHAAGRPVLAVDLPSGIDADTGAVLGTAVRATATATFAIAKPGLLVGAGREHAGRVHVIEIGIPRSALVAAVSRAGGDGCCCAKLSARLARRSSQNR